MRPRDARLPRMRTIRRQLRPARHLASHFKKEHEKKTQLQTPGMEWQQLCARDASTMTDAGVSSVTGLPLTLRISQDALLRSLPV